MLNLKPSQSGILAIVIASLFAATCVAAASPDAETADASVGDAGVSPGKLARITQTIDANSGTPISERIAAIKTVEDARYRPAEAMLITTLDDPTPEVVEAAVHALGSLGTDRSIPYLTRLLRDQYQFGAAEALGQMGSPIAVPALFQFLTENLDFFPPKDLGFNPRFFSIRSSIQALLVIGSPEALRDLLHLYVRYEPRRQKFFRDQIQEGLDAVCRIPTYAKKYGTEFTRLCDNRNAERLGSEIAAPKPKKMSDEEFARARMASIEEIARKNEKGAELSLIMSLSSENPMVKNAAIRALGVVGGEQSVGPLLQILHNETNYEAAEALAKIHHPTSADRLNDFIRESVAKRKFQPQELSDKLELATKNAILALASIESGEALLMDIDLYRELEAPELTKWRMLLVNHTADTCRFYSKTLSRSDEVARICAFVVVRFLDDVAKSDSEEAIRRSARERALRVEKNFKYYYYLESPWTHTLNSLFGN